MQAVLPGRGDVVSDVDYFGGGGGGGADSGSDAATPIRGEAASMALGYMLEGIDRDDVAVPCRNGKDWLVDHEKMEATVVEMLVARKQVRVVDGVLAVRVDVGRYSLIDGKPEDDVTLRVLVERAIVDLGRHVYYIVSQGTGCSFQISNDKPNQEWLVSSSMWFNPKAGFLFAHNKRICGLLSVEKNLEAMILAEASATGRRPGVWASIGFQNVVYEIGDVPPRDTLHLRARGGNGGWQWVRDYSEEDVVVHRMPCDWFWVGDDESNVVRWHDIELGGDPADDYSIGCVELTDFGQDAPGLLGRLVTKYMSGEDRFLPRWRPEDPVEAWDTVTTYDSSWFVHHVIAESLVWREKQVALGFGGPGGCGKTGIIKYLRRMVGDGAEGVGADIPDQAVAAGGARDHASWKFRLRGRTAIFFGDFKENDWTGIAEYVAAETATSARGMGVAHASKGFAAGFLAMFSFNKTRLTGVIKGANAHFERRFARVPIVTMTAEDLAELRLYEDSLEGSGYDVETMSYIEYLLGLVGRDTWYPLVREDGQGGDVQQMLMPFAHAVEDGLFDSGLRDTESIVVGMGLRVCTPQWGPGGVGDLTGSKGIICKQVLAKWAQDRGVVVGRKAVSDEISALYAMDQAVAAREGRVGAVEVLLRDVTRHRDFAKRVGMKANTLDVYIGLESEVAGDEVSAEGRVREESLTARISEWRASRDAEAARGEE